MSPPSCLPAEIDLTNLLDITRISDAWRRYLDPATGKEHDGAEYARRMHAETQMDIDDWINPNDSFPDWPDVGRRVEVQDRDGHTVEGRLHADNYGDIPVFSVTCDDGTKVDFADCERWRFGDGPRD